MPFAPPPEIRGLTPPQWTIKASHNSYLNDHGWTPVDMLDSPADPPYAGRCRGLEFDIIQDGTAARWCVSHDYPYQVDASIQLSEYLRQVVEWSTWQNGDHDPVYLYFDCKSGGSEDVDFPGKFDAYVRAALADVSLYTPSDLLAGSGATSLLAASIAKNWAPLSKLDGHFIPVLTGDSVARRKAYLAGNSGARLCFVDCEVDLFDSARWSKVALPNQIFVNFHGQPNLNNLDAWLAQFTQRKGIVMRGYEIDDEFTWETAMRCGVNILATDQVGLTSWATVGDYPVIATEGQV